MIPVQMNTPQKHPSKYLAGPLYALGALLVVAGLFDSSFASVAIGVIGLLSAHGLRHPERHVSQTLLRSGG